MSYSNQDYLFRALRSRIISAELKQTIMYINSYKLRLLSKQQPYVETKVIFIEMEVSPIKQDTIDCEYLAYFEHPKKLRMIF